VRIEQLQAHLEAYVKTISQTTTLRLCNRFGTGDDCHVSKLPIELVTLIEEHIVEPERQDALDFGSQVLRCCEGRCKPLDHYLEEDLYHLYHATYGCSNERCKKNDPAYFEECCHSDCGNDKCPAWNYNAESDSKIRKQLYDNPNVHYKDLSDCCMICQFDFGHMFDENGEFFQEQREIFNVHFGISVCTARLRPTSMSGPNHTITAYLTLPGNISRHEQWRSDGYYGEENGCGMPVHLGATPTEQSLSRFSRALKILGLQASTHPSLEGGLVLSPPPADTLASNTDTEAVVQPQVTLLLRSKTEPFT